MTDKIPLLLIVLLIWYGWSEPFSVRYAQIKATVTGQAVQESEESVAQPANGAPGALSARQTTIPSAQRSSLRATPTPEPKDTSGSFQRVNWGNSSTLKGGGNSKQ